MELSKIFIIIVNWNGWQDTYECLDSLSEIVLPPLTELNIVVVDNASANHSVERLNEYIQNHSTQKNVVLLKNKHNAGFAGGNNFGIKYALEKKADWILMLNNDTIVDKDFLVELITGIKKDRKIAFANPKIFLGADKNENKIWFIGGKINPINMRGTHIKYGLKDEMGFLKEEINRSAYATGCCLLFKASLIDDIGFMPEEYFLYYEDAEWSLRARRKGLYCVVVPSAKIWHKGAASSKEGSPNYIRYHVRNGLLFIFRNGNPAQILFAYMLTFPRFLWQIFKLIFSIKRSWAKAVLQGIIDVWTVKKGKIA